MGTADLHQLASGRTSPAGAFIRGSDTIDTLVDHDDIGGQRIREAVGEGRSAPARP